jgi:hypothetical protein
MTFAAAIMQPSAPRRNVQAVRGIALGLIAALSTPVPSPPPSPPALSSPAPSPSVEGSPSPSPSATPFSGTISSIPLFARFAADGPNPKSYTADINLNASLHKWIFTFHFHRDGQVAFQHPDDLSVTISSVPTKYSRVFGELGTPRSWPIIYKLVLLDAENVDGLPGYRLRGVPRQPSDVDHVIIRMSDEHMPIHARWFLRSGWTLATTVVLESVQDYLVPKIERADITGHGYRIHTVMTYSNYVVNVAD